VQEKKARAKKIMKKKSPCSRYHEKKNVPDFFGTFFGLFRGSPSFSSFSFSFFSLDSVFGDFPLVTTTTGVLRGMWGVMVRRGVKPERLGREREEKGEKRHKK
jgi:hypothetical protein